MLVQKCIGAVFLFLAVITEPAFGTDKNFEFEVEVSSGFVAPLKLKDGRLFSVDRELNAAHSADGGRTWDVSAGPLVDQHGKVRHDPDYTRAHNLCRLASGAIGLAYWQREPSKSTIRHCGGFFRKSDDESKTWSEPVRVTPPNTPGFATFVTQLSSGRLIFANEYAFTQATRSDPGVDSMMSVCTVFRSDDQGQTWTESVDSLFVWQNNGGSMHFVETPCVAETADGRLLIFMRTEMQRLAQSYSEDGGIHWGLTELNSLVSSRSEVLLLRVPSTGDLLCVWNQASSEEIRTGFYRSRLSSAISKDSGKTWQHFRTIVMSKGMKKVNRISEAAPASWLESSGAVPHDLDLIPPEGFRSVRAPRASIIDGKVYLIFDDRIYKRTPERQPGWQRVYHAHKLRVIPLSWFYGQE